MGFIHLLVLSIIQGLTEFLPVSSSGHLVVIPRIFGEVDQGILIDLSLHFGTLLAVLIYFRRDIFSIVTAVLCWNREETRHLRNLGLFIVAASIPAVAVGFVVHHFYPDGIRSTFLIAVNTIVFGVLMGIADKKMPQVNEVGNITFKQAMIIGCVQALALNPGTSRSGITMTIARFLGFKRADAARFSFLLAIPATAGACFISFLELIKSDQPGLMHDAALAAAMSFVVGLAAIHYMLKWLARFGLMPYVIYRIILGIFLLFYFGV